MRSSLFPPDVQRPWRDVLVYGGHHVRLHLRSKAWWTLVFIGPLLLFLYFETFGQVDTSQFTRELWVVAPNPEIAAALQATHHLHPLTVHPTPPIEEGVPTLWVEGPSLAEATARLEPEGAIYPWQQIRAEVLLANTRALAFTTEAERAAWLPAPGQAGPSQAEPSEAAQSASEWIQSFVMLPMWCGAALGLIAGYAGGGGARIRRELGLHGVLRVGTADAVLFLGAVVEAAGTVALAVAGWLTAGAIAVVLTRLGGGGGLSPWLWTDVTTSLPAFLLAGALAYGVSLGLGSLLAAVGEHHPRAAGLLGFSLPLLPIVCLPLLLRLPDLSSTTLTLVSLLPGIGLFAWPLAWAEAPPSLAPWLPAALLWQAIGALASLRLAVWCYCLDEPVLSALRHGPWWLGRQR